MKNLVVLPIIFLLMMMSSCSEETYFGSGNLISEFRNVANFTKVSSEGVFEVTITQGTTQSLEMIADDNIIQKIKTKVVGNELRIYIDDNNYREITAFVNIIVPSVNSIKNFGAGNISISEVNNNGNFYIYNSGTGKISIDGNAQSLTLKNEGSGKFEGFLFTVNNSNVNIIGSGDCNIKCANILNVNIEGSGDVYYKGFPVIDADISGSGKIVNAN